MHTHNHTCIQKRASIKVSNLYKVQMDTDKKKGKMSLRNLPSNINKSKKDPERSEIKRE